MPTGKVKWFSVRKGFGCIMPDDRFKAVGTNLRLFGVLRCLLHKQKELIMSKRELIGTGTDKRYVRRDEEDRFKESVDVGRSPGLKTASSDERRQTRRRQRRRRASK